MEYTKDYVEWDEFGMSRVRCMCCNTPVIERAYKSMRSVKDPTKSVEVMVLRRLPNHREVIVTLSDGSTTGLPHCAACATHPDPVDYVEAQKLRLKTLEKEMQESGKPTQYIDSVLAPQKKMTMTTEVF